MTLAASCTHGWRGDRLVELVGFTTPGGEDVVERLSEGFGSSGFGEALESRTRITSDLTGADGDLVVRRDLRALLAGVHGILPAVDDAVVDAVLDVRALVLLPRKEPLVVGFVLGEQQRHVAFAGRDELTEHGMRCRHRARACRRLDLPERRLLRGPVGCGNPRRPVVAEPQRRQEVQFGGFRSPVGRRDRDEDVLRAALGVLHEDVEVAVVVEDAGVEQFVLEVSSRNAGWLVSTRSA